MNFALPALVVFVLLLPGFVVRSRFKRVERLSIDYSPFGQVVTEAVVWAAGLHLLWIQATALLTVHTLRADVVLELVSGDAAAQTRALEWVASEPGSIALYFFSLLALAYLGPLTLRLATVHFGWDRAGSPASSWLRFSQAPWYYLLSGADFRPDQRPDFISISAIVDVAGQPILYSGVLEDYFLDQDGQLDRLILSEVMRRPLGKDKSFETANTTEDRFYRIDGDYFVLRYSEATTLNVEYIKLDRDGAEVLGQNDGVHQ